MNTKHFFRQLSSFGPFVECKREDEGAIEFVVAPSHAASTEPVSLPTNDEVYAKVCQMRGKLNFYVSTNAVNDTMAAVRELANFTATQAAQLTEQDAARYRFLRDNGVPGDQGYADYPLLVYQGFGENSLLPDELDIAIDAAILANQSQKG